MSKGLLEHNIRKAQLEIEKNKELVAEGRMRQHYHFMPQTGWLNDPNGLIYFRGKYHFFFQHNPYGAFWDCMHWGHAVSDDMFHWEYLPLALAPSEVYDNHPKGGCFSGCAIERDGMLYLMYTGSTNTGRGTEQTQCIAYSKDGVHFEKYEGNPVLTAPEGVSIAFFRDPKIWKNGDVYYMVCGGSRNNRGLALLYRSNDLLHWDFMNILAESRGEWGIMWECPDFYPLGNKFVLTFSPMKSGDHTSVYMVGDFDYGTGRFCPSVCNEIDWGFDYYAPQSFLAPDGRRIMVAWANGWEWMPLWKDWGRTYQEGWCGWFNIPLEVRLKSDNTLQFLPIEEIKSLRQNLKHYDCLLVTEEMTEVKAGDGVSFELKMKIDLEETDAEALEIILRCGDGKQAVCRFDFRYGEMTVDRSSADGWSIGVSRSTLHLRDKRHLDVHILSDQSSLEIFSNEYQCNHSNNIFASDAQNRIKLRTYNGKAVIQSIETYGLKDCCRREEKHNGL